jgi:hypothetical protein
MSYKEKLLKYKNKYYSLKNKINQKGGTVTKLSEPDGTFIFPISDPRITWSTFNTDIKLYSYEESFNLNLVKIQLNDDLTKPILFVIAGFSQDSFMSAAYVILTKLKLLGTKFTSIYILDYSSMKKFQDTICGERKTDLGHFDTEPEERLNKKIATSIHEILTMLNLDNIHLLGKSNGGWIVTLLLKMYPELYKGLYLAVPGIPNPDKYLLRMDPSILEGINFVFGFSQQDNYKFSFGKISNQEKDRYDDILFNLKEKIPELKYRTYMENNGLPPPENKKDAHELYQSMIDHIILSLQI